MTDTQNLDANEDIRETAKSLEEMVKSIEKMRNLVKKLDGCPEDGDEITVIIPGHVPIESRVTIVICGVTINFIFTDKEGKVECDRCDLSTSEHTLECAIAAIARIMQK